MLLACLIQFKKSTFHLPASLIAKQLLLLLVSHQGWKTTYM